MLQFDHACTVQELREKSDPKKTSITLFSRSRIAFIVSLILTGAILMLLIIPVYSLWKLTTGQQNPSMTAIIGVLALSTFGFSFVSSTFTKAKRHEMLAAAAG